MRTLCLKSNVWQALRGVFCERRCTACHAPFLPEQTASHLLCSACQKALEPFSASSCPLCGLPFAAPDMPRVPCGACLHMPPPWDHLYFHGIYEGLLRRVLLRFKFGQEFSLLPLLGGMLAAARTKAACDIVIPIPRHGDRLRVRGWNPTHELAHWMALQRDIAFESQCLLRSSNTVPQVRLCAEARRSNPRGSFAAQGVQGKRVLLVDDTLTTGGTLRHATLTLLEAGAASVTVSVVARTLPRKSL